MIIGSAGSGKSTLAAMLGDALNLPVYHMDKEVYWLAGWVERERQDMCKQVERIIAQDEWVLDGNHSRSLQARESRAEQLIWLQVPIWKRIPRVIHRAFRDRGRSRSDMAEGCPEQLRKLPGFLKFILRTRAATNAKHQAFFETTQLPKVRLTTFTEVNDFVDGIATCTPLSSNGGAR